jgi:hypothetical protein
VTVGTVTFIWLPRPLAISLHYMPHSLPPFPPALARVKASANACMVARAQGAFRAATGHFAAVMGNAMESTLNPSLSSAWSVTGAIDANETLMGAIGAVDGADPFLRDHLRSEIGMHVEWCLNECLDDLNGHLESLADPLADHPLPTNLAADPEQDCVDGVAVRSDVSGINDSHEDSVGATNRELIASYVAIQRVIDAYMASSSPEEPGMSESRRQAIQTHKDQLEFITNRAQDLRFSDLARDGCDAAIQSLRNGWRSEPRALFNDPGYLKLQKEKRAIATERVNHEIELQSYFDHHSQGASRSESVKPERIPLKIAILSQRKQAFARSNWSTSIVSHEAMKCGRSFPT